MKIVTIKMDLVIDYDMINPNTICRYLNEKLYDDPEFFGEFRPENIESIKEFV